MKFTLTLLSIGVLPAILMTMTQLVWAAPENDLPEDLPITPKVVHNLKHPLEGTNQLEVGYSYLYGDKFLQTHGLYAQDYFFTGETLAFGGGFAYYNTSVTSEAQEVAVRGAVPLMYNPTFVIKGSVLFQPVYGKLIIGSHIQHFRWGIEGIFHGTEETVIDLDGTKNTSNNRIRFGPGIATRLVTVISENFSAVIRGEMLIHAKHPTDTAGLRQLWSVSASLGYKVW